MNDSPVIPPVPDHGDELLVELRTLIQSARARVASTVNAELTMLYWNIGQRIRTVVLRDERAEYGAMVVAGLARQLTLEFGRGFEDKNLRRMMQLIFFYSSISLSPLPLRVRDETVSPGGAREAAVIQFVPAPIGEGCLNDRKEAKSVYRLFL